MFADAMARQLATPTWTGSAPLNPTPAPDIMHPEALGSDVAQVPQMLPAHPAVPDSQNPAAVSYATAMLHRLVSAHLLGGMPQGGTADPTALWRGLSQGLGANRGALLQFLAAGQHPAATAAQQPAGQTPQLVSEHGYAPSSAPQLVSEHGAGQSYVQQPMPGGGYQVSDHPFLGGGQLPNHPVGALTPAKIAAVIQVLTHGGGTPYLGHH